MDKKVRVCCILSGVLLFTLCQKTYREYPVKEIQMSIESNGISADFIIEKPKIKSCRDLELKVVLSNKTESPKKVNALLFNFATVMLKVRKADGTPVHPGPPPMPPADDGSVGRIQLLSGQSHEWIFSGAEFFGSDVTPGKYQIMFTYTSPENQYGDWQGTIESPWMDFEVVKELSNVDDATEEPGFESLSKKIGFLVYDMKLLEENVTDGISILVDSKDRSRGYASVWEFPLKKKISEFLMLASTYFTSRKSGLPKYLNNRERILHRCCDDAEKFYTLFRELFGQPRSQISVLSKEVLEDCKALDNKLGAHLDLLERENVLLEEFIQKEIRERIYIG